MGLNAATNPISINNSDIKIKESELDDVKFDFEDSEHIYDDPNLFTSVNGQSQSGNAAVAKLRALDYSSPVPKLTGAAPGHGTTAEKDPRYTNLPGYATPRPVLSTAPAPPGYASPRTSGLVTAPSLKTSSLVPAPEVPNTSRPKRPISKEQATIAPTAGSNPFSSAETKPPGDTVSQQQDTNPFSSTEPKPPGIKQDTPVPTSGPTLSGSTAPNPPGYATPRPLSVEKKRDTTEKAATQEEKEAVGYFSLLDVNKREEGGAYQELASTLAKESAQKQNGSAVAGLMEEDDQYVVMNSPQMKTPIF